MNLNKKFNLKPLKYIFLLEWSILFGKEWVLPKIGVAIGVFAISKILFSIDPATWITGESGKNLNALFEKDLNIFYWIILIYFALLLITVLVFRFDIIPKQINKISYLSKFSIARKVFLADQKLPLLINGLIFILNIYYVPLLLAIYISLFLNMGNNPLGSNSARDMVVLIMLSALLHRLKNLEENPKHHITYTFKYSEKEKLQYKQEFEETEKMLKKKLSIFEYVNEPKIVAHSKDGGISLVIPIFLDFKNWDIYNGKENEKQKEKFLAALLESENEWTQKKWIFHRFDSFN